MSTVPTVDRDDLQDLLKRLTGRSSLRSEATTQADIRQILLTGGLNLPEHDLDVNLEARVGNRPRIDIEVDYTIIEVKRNLASETVVPEAEIQLGIT